MREEGAKKESRVGEPIICYLSLCKIDRETDLSKKCKISMKTLIDNSCKVGLVISNNSRLKHQ